MKYTIILLCILNFPLLCQDTIFLDTPNTLKSSELEMVDSISKMIETYNKLVETLETIDCTPDSIIRDDLKSYIYSRFAITIDTSFNKVSEYFLKSMTKYGFMGSNFSYLSRNSKKTFIESYNRIERGESIFRNKYLINTLAEKILVSKKLEDCDFINAKRNTDGYIIIGGHTLGLSILLRDKKPQLEELIKSTNNDCLKNNIKEIIEAGKNHPQLKDYYK